MRHDLSALIKEEMVKRFENVVKEEIRASNIAVEKSNREVSSLKDSFEEHKKLLESVKENNSKKYNMLYERFLEELQKQVKDFDEQRRFIKTNSMKMNNVADLLSKEIKSLVSTDILNERMNGAKQEIKDLERKFSEQAIEVKKQIYDTSQSLSMYLNKEFNNFNAKIQEVRTTQEALSSESKVNAVDARGVMRELQVYKKEVFVIEKKIENLYSKIDKLESREL